MSAFALFSSVDQPNHASRVEGENYTAMFGSVSIDFTKQPLAAGDHTLSATALFGSIKLIFPADVELRTEGMPIFGSVEVKDRRAGMAQAPGGVRVTVTAVALFGSVELVRSGTIGSPADEPYQLTGDEQFHPVTGERIIDGEARPYEGVTRKISPDQ